MPTIPGWRPEKSRRPWWATALVGGVGVGIALLAGLGFVGPPAAQGHEPRVTTSSILPAGTLSLDERLSRMESSIEGLKNEVRELRDRLPAKK